ncbi:MAG: hypothetical protein WD688_26500 [Candidatus Binatia bacterium]
MLAQSIGTWALIVIFASAGSAAEGDEPLPAGDQKVHCPQCRHEGLDVAQLHKNADRLYGQFKAKEAAVELLKVLRSEPQNFEALAKLSRAYIDIGDSISESSTNWQERRLKEYRSAEDFARRAVKVDPGSTWGHFYVAASLGNIAVISPVSRQVELAGEIREALEKSIALDAGNGFAYHAYGVWHRKMAEIGQMSRMLASVLYGRSLPVGSMGKSIEYLKKAITINPTVIISRLELARTHVALEEWPAARSLLSSIRNLPVRFSDDAKHKQKAEELLEEIKDR